MISGLPGFLLNAFSIILLSALVIILLISLLLGMKSWRTLVLSAEDRKWALWIVVISPWLIGVMATSLVVLLSQPKISARFNNEWVHWHHLSEFTLTSWHGYLVLAMIVFAVIMLARVLRRVVTLNNTTMILSAFSSARDDGVLELDSDACAAFTAGIRRPKCYMTRALIDQLSSREYEVIRLHELTHARFHDPARKALFQVLSSFFPSPVARVLNAQMSTAMEQVADARVAESVADKAFIARALLKVKRLAGRAAVLPPAGLEACHFGIDSVEQRIRYLLSEDETTPLSLVVVFALMVVLALTCALGADALHHAIELSLHHSY